MNPLLQLARNHYENFPVGSWLISSKYREVIHLVYAYARVADDIADEGSESSFERIEKLNEWEQFLMESVRGKPADDFFVRLAAASERFHLPVCHFQDLLVAFRKDAENLNYETFDDLMEYCRYSANPIGRLMLAIFDCSTAQTVQLSDSICTALQLTNFWQDISVDTRRNRFYIPLVELKEHGLRLNDLSTGEHRPAFQKLMKLQIDRTEKLFEEGKPLIDLVPKDFQRELELIWRGGMRVLKKIKKVNYDTRMVRPTLTFSDKIVTLVQTFV